MTDREALRSMVIYAQREAEGQDLDLTAYLLSLALASLMPEGLRPEPHDHGTSMSDSHHPHVRRDGTLQ